MIKLARCSLCFRNFKGAFGALWLPAAAGGAQRSSLVLAELAQCHPRGGLRWSLPSWEAIHLPAKVSLCAPEPENRDCWL